MRNTTKGYWHNFDRTYFGIKWSKDLSRYLEQNLENEECGHTLKYTNEFFSKRFFVKRILQLWIYSQYCCDCEALINTSWRDDLDWREELEEYKILENHIVYKDGTWVDLRLYKNGLKAGNLLKLKTDFYQRNLDGDVFNHFPKGDLFVVMNMDPAVGYKNRIILLNTKQSRSIKLNDDYQIFDKFERVDEIEHFEKQLNQIKSDEKRIGLYRALGEAHSNEGHQDLAIDYFKKAVNLSIKINGHDEGATFLSRYSLANEYFDQQKYEKAIKIFETAIKQNMKSPTNRTYKGFESDIKEKKKYTKGMIKAKL